MLLQFDLKHIHKVNFYPSDNNFTQALLVLLVTNMISDKDRFESSPRGPNLGKRRLVSKNRKIKLLVLFPKEKMG